LGRGDADDLISLLRTIALTDNIASVLQNARSEIHGSIISDENPVNSIVRLLKRLSLDGPKALALRISEAIDEDSLAASHRDEQVESANMISMAQDVLSAEGKPDDLEAMSQIVRSKTAVKSLRQLNTDEDDVWIMRRNASSVLEKLHEDLAALHREKSTLTEALKSQSETPSLTLRWTPGLGHICHIRGVKDVRSSMEKFGSARSASTTKSTRSFYLPEWSNLGGRIDQTKMQIRAEEQRVFRELREQVVINLVKLRRNAAVLDELDVACSAASLAAEQNLVRPILNESTSHIIIGGKHATVHLGLEEQGRAFVSNDCFVGDPERIWLITGPNMAGKSTFLRQNALISVLAQVGSFVPADHVEIGIVDRIFSRIGSADNLYQDQSTFMVEMLETAAILKQATPRSFVIMDEVGRGTTPEDGIAVGYACLHHLYHTNRCRTLFATHFHALADMTSDWGGVGCYCTDVAETASGSFSYVHRLRPGVNKRSHALKVATLAGPYCLTAHSFPLLIVHRYSESCNRCCEPDSEHVSGLCTGGGPCPHCNRCGYVSTVTERRGRIVRSVVSAALYTGKAMLSSLPASHFIPNFRIRSECTMSWTVGTVTSGFSLYPTSPMEISRRGLMVNFIFPPTCLQSGNYRFL
jgi:DNA mismatch repair ATPase MutS